MNAAPGHVIAGCFALSAFVVGLISGLAAHNPAVTVLVRALLAMIICYPLGAFVGVVCERAINRHVAANRRELHLDGIDETPEEVAQDVAERAPVEAVELGIVEGEPVDAGVAEHAPAA